MAIKNRALFECLPHQLITGICYRLLQYCIFTVFCSCLRTTYDMCMTNRCAYYKLVIIRPHRTYRTVYIDAAYYYQSSSLVGLLVCHTSEPCKNS